MELNVGREIEARLINLLEVYEKARLDPENLSKREHLAVRLAEFNFLLFSSLITESGNTVRWIYTDKIFRDTLKGLVILEAEKHGN